MKIRPVEAELSHADGRTDMTKLRGISRFSQFCPKTRLFGCHSHCGTDVIQTRNSRHITDIVKQLFEHRRLWSLNVINRHSAVPEPEFRHYIKTSLGFV